MDSFHNQQQQQGRWFPSPSPPPPPAAAGGGYYSPPPQQHSSYPPPHHQPPPHQWGPPSHHYHHHHPIPNHPPPPPPPPYHHQQPPSVQPPLPYAPSHPPPQSHHHQYPPHHQLPPRPMPPPHSAFPPAPNQPWGNPSWPQHHGWEYPERVNPYNNEEDWAARAKAWASAKPGPENHHIQSHLTSVGRMDEQHSYAYHDQYQQAVGPPGDSHHTSSFLQSSNQQLPVSMMDPLKQQVNHLHGSTSFTSGPSSYGTGYNAEDETTTNNGPTPSLQKSYAPSSSIYEQEVSYSYSSAPGSREAVHQSEGSHISLPMHASSVQEGNHSHSTLPVQMISTEPPHFSQHRQSTEFLPDASDQPLEFAGRHDSEPKINYGQGGGMDQNPTPSSIHAWTSAAPGVAFPQIPLGPTTTQFDPTFVHPSPVFGGIPAPGFQPSVPPVSAPFGLGPGASLHAAAFPGDANIERPKKAAVPNWLREEIIKKKNVIPSSISAQPTGNTFDSFGSEDGDKSFRRAVDQADSKIIDSTRSTEDEEDDEEDVEAEKSAAINQEIKRVLTEVLLKVTDELFDEIATKVLNEDEPFVGGIEESTVIGNQKASSPPAISAPKASAKVLVPIKPKTNKENGVGEYSSTSSPAGNLLGLANYDSDDGDYENEIHSSKMPSSGKKETASRQQENNNSSSTNDSKSEKNGAKSEKNGANIDGMARKHRAQTENGLPAVNDLHYPDKASEGISAVSEEPIALQSNDTVGEKDGKRQESISRHANSEKSLTKDYRERESKRLLGTDKYTHKSDDKPMKKTSRDTSDASDSIVHEENNKLKEKMDKRDKLERSDDRSSTRRSHGKESDSRSSKHSSNDRKESTEAKREKDKEDGERRRGRVREDKEDRSTRATKDSSRYNSRSPSPRASGKRDNSFSHGSASGDEPSDSSKKRKQQSFNTSLSPSLTKSRKRQVSRSPHSKHSHRRHSPYSSTERRRKSRSISPVHRRSSTRK